MAIDQLRQAQRAGQPGGAAANNGYVRFHLRTLNTFKGFAESDHKQLANSNWQLAKPLFTATDAKGQRIGIQPSPLRSLRPLR
jgi:hypothetical protein